MENNNLSNRTRVFSIWDNMRSRCLNKNATGFNRYGGRGISIDDEWSCFDTFRKWAYRSGYSENLTLDRINVNGNYEPSNCRWTTRGIQARNTVRLRSDNTSGFRGVYFHNNTSRWKSTISVNRKRLHLGSFKCKTCAALAYDTYVIENKLEHTRNF